MGQNHYRVPCLSVVQFGRMPALGVGGREFKSRHLDHKSRLQQILKHDIGEYINCDLKSLAIEG